MRISAWNNDDMRGWFHLVSAPRAEPDPPTCRGIAKKRLMGFEPTTFCMAMAKVTWEPRPTTIGICGGFGHCCESRLMLLYEAICADMQGFGHFSREVPKTRRAGSSAPIRSPDTRADLLVMSPSLGLGWATWG